MAESSHQDIFYSLITLASDSWVLGLTEKGSRGEELSMLYFNHANEHISLGQEGSFSKRNWLISVYSYYPSVEHFKVIWAHWKAFSEKHYNAPLMVERMILEAIKIYSDVGGTGQKRKRPCSCTIISIKESIFLDVKTMPRCV